MRKAQQILEIKKKKGQQPMPKEERPSQDQEQVAEEASLQRKNMFGAFSSVSDEETNQPLQPQQQNVTQETLPAPKKKKKRKPKKVQQQDEEELLDEIIKDNQLGNKHKAYHYEQDEPNPLRVFVIHENKFNYQNELRKYFKNIEQEQAPQNYEGMNKREKRFHKAMHNVKMKKSILIPTMLNYFPIAEKFEYVEKEDVLWIEASKKYEVLQEEYESIKNSNDIQQMFDFMQRNPYHTDALYNIGEFFRLKGNYKEADALIQRIIYIYQYSSQYNIGQFVKEERPKRQIAYGRFSSSLFMSLFKFVDILGKKGCYRAALQYCKFVLKLNLDDPSASLICLDYNALSAKQYKFLIDFTSAFPSYLSQEHSKTTLYWMPNYMYSVAFAKFMDKVDIPSKAIVEEVPIDAHITFTDDDLQAAMDLQRLPHFQKQSAQVLLLRAILLYPRVFMELASKNDYQKQNLFHKSFQGYQKGSFKNIMGHNFFQLCPQNYFYSFINLESESDSRGFLKVIDCYVTRSKILWKNNRVMLWVKAATGFLLNYIDSHQDFNYQSFQESLTIKNKETQNIPNICLPFGRYENVSRANFTDQVERIDLNNIQDNQGFHMQNQPANFNPVNVENNPLRLFFNTLLPWVHLPGQGPNNNDPDMPIIEQDHP